MGTLMLVIGILAILVLVASKVVNIDPKIVKNAKIVGLIGFFGGLIIASSLYVERGKIAFVVFPTGTAHAISDNGLHLIMPFSRVYMWDQYVDIAARPVDAEGHIIERDSDKETVDATIPNGVPIRFIDQVTGNLYLSVRFEIPTNESDFIRIANKYKTQDNLINNTLIGVIKEQSTNTSFMHSAEGYVTGGASEFKQDLESALKDGGFVVRNEFINDSIFDSEIAKNNEPRKLIEIKKITRLVKVKDSKGVPLRNPHEIAQNHITVSQVLIDDVSLEAGFKKKLEQTRDISAQRRIEAQKVETAQMAQQRILAEGERDKAAERVKQEMEQVRSLISIETKLKSEETNRQLAEIKLQTAKLEADARKTTADAEAYANGRLVSAGLSPQERAEWDFKTKTAIAEAFAKMEPPSTIISGGGGDATNSLIQAAMAKQFMSKD